MDDLTTPEPRDFESAVGERATVTLDDGRAFRAQVIDVRLESEGSRYLVESRLLIVKDERRG